MMLARLALVALACLISLPAKADDRFARLAEPSIVAIMRHALAPGTSDPAGFDVNDCSTQRNLDRRGRDQARAIGAAIRASGVTIDRVLTSQWCRCRETAELLGVGPVDEFAPLNSFFEDRSTATAQTLQTASMLLSLHPRETVLLVTHQVNITALTGRGVSSGEVFLLEIGRDGSVTVIDEVLIAP